ncbi:MAG: PAS domain-containing sensor histidine kinase [Flavobacteriales bacterium]|nr:PAS domain-containing sensor histidine kinase [Flavobacteriales bacterium]MCB9203952.1 PAS domain-containing sensor histidine kinase [Flavobacteriales bacterium]
MKAIETDRLPEMVNNDKLRHLLELAVNTTTDGIALLNADSEYYYLNRAHVEQFGYSDASELLGKTWHVFYAQDEIARIESDIFPLLVKNGTWRGETVGVKKDGSPIHQEISLTFTEDGGLICVTRILEDLRKAEKELQAVNSSLASIVTHATSGILLEDAERKIIEVNSQLGVLFESELDPEYLRGTDCRDALPYVSVQTNDPEGFVRNIEQRITDNVPVFNEMIQLKDGSYLERDFIPLFSDNELQGYLWMFNDITEHERAKESLQGLVSKEKELNEMRSKLVRTVSHEFKKPILNTLTGIQLLQGQLKNSGEGLYSKALDHIVEELQGLNESVSKLVKYEALYDRSEATTKPVLVRNLVTNYLHYHFKLFLLSEKFEIEELATEETINVDLDLFNLALKNVVENALKYTEYNEKITIRSSVEGKQVLLSFSNPVNKKTRPDKSQLGTPLYRANPGDEKGLGLGLGIVQHVTDLLGGWVNYEVSESTYNINLIFPLSETN